MNYVSLSTQIHYKEYGDIIRPFGPSIMKQTISEDMLTDLTTVANRLQQFDLKDVDFRGNLAGNIADERQMMGAVSDDTMLEIKERIAIYLAMLENKPTHQIEHFVRGIYLESLWVNFQKAWEFNPPHQHTGEISYVIYLENPVDYEIEAQHPTQHGTAPMAGKINFRYGEAMPQSNHHIRITPTRGDMLIFPNWLEHQVFPFTQEGITRISVAGNAGLTRDNISGMAWQPPYKYKETTANEDE